MFSVFVYEIKCILSVHYIYSNYRSIVKIIRCDFMSPTGLKRLFNI